jgi:hypothetical protein
MYALPLWLDSLVCFAFASLFVRQEEDKHKNLLTEEVKMVRKKIEIKPLTTRKKLQVLSYHLVNFFGVISFDSVLGIVLSSSHR